MSDIEQQRMVVTNSTRIVKVLTSFFMDVFREISDAFSFDLTKLNSIRSVMSDAQIKTFKDQIFRMQQVQSKIGQPMPSVYMLDHFCNLLQKLRASIGMNGNGTKYDSFVNSSIDERASSEDEGSSEQEEDE